MTKKEERYAIITIFLTVLGLIAAYLAVPQVQDFFKPTPTPTPAPVVAGSADALPEWTPELVRVPAGAFLMGSTDADALADEDEKPQHSVSLPEYWIGKTEVTNAQFRPFVEGDGYLNQAYWTDEGWAWRMAEKIRQPEYWETPDPRFNGDAKPVVGVSWYEAVAYVRWLSAQTGHPFHLPTEAEWEKAARGPDGVIYPWGDTWDADRLNSGGRIDKPLPVGQYPAGASVYGALDMAGNVWEWCATKWRKDYPYRVEDEWADTYLEGDAARVLRGGAWWDGEDAVRGACRGDSSLPHRFVNSGFRVASYGPLRGSDE